MDNTNGKLMTLDEAAEFLMHSRSTLYRWVTEKKVPCHKVQGHWRFFEGELRMWIRGRIAVCRQCGGIHLITKPVTLPGLAGPRGALDWRKDQPKAQQKTEMRKETDKQQADARGYGHHFGPMPFKCNFCGEDVYDSDASDTD